MNIIKLFLMVILILLTNRILLKLDYYKIFKKNSTKEIFFLNMILSVIIGYLLYKAIYEIYILSVLI